MPSSIDPLIRPNGSFSNTKPATKQAISSNLNQGLKNPFHYTTSTINDGTTDARAAILAADAEGPSTLPPGTYAIASNMTLTNRVYPDNGAKIKPASGVTVTIPAGFEAGDLQHCFDVSAGGSFVIAKVDYVTPNHFGALPDDSTDNTTAIQECMDARAVSKVSVKIPPGIYQSQKVTFDALDDIRIFGTGTLKAVAPRWVGGILQFEGCTDIDIDGITFDTNVANMAAIQTSVEGDSGDYNLHYCYALRFKENAAPTPCQRITVRNCFFKNLYTRHIDVATGYYLTVQDNYFSSPAQNNQSDCQFVSFTSGSGDNVIKNNSFVVDSVTSTASNASGVICSGIVLGSLLIDGNFFKNCGRDETGLHRISSIDLYANCENVKIVNNTILGARHAAVNMTSCRNIKMDNNYIEQSVNDFFDWGLIQISGAGFGSGYGHSHDISITKNTIVCTDATPQAGAWAVGITSTDWQDHMYDVTFADNEIRGFDIGLIHGGSVYSLNLLRNKIRVVSTGITTLDESSLAGTQTSGKHGNVHVEHNDIANLTDGSLAGGIGIAVHYSGTFTGTTFGEAVISNNIVKTTGFGILTRDINVVIEDNQLEDCSYGLYIRVCDQARTGGNVFVDMTTQDVLLDTVTSMLYTKPFITEVEPNGNLAASPGAEAIYRAGGTGMKKWLKDTGTGNTGWILPNELPKFTSTELNDVTHVANTTNKSQGKPVFNTTVGKPVYAVGSAAADDWNDAVGTLVNDPV